MSEPDRWLMDLDTSGDVHVANTTEGLYVFYTEREEEFIRTDCVVDVQSNR